MIKISLYNTIQCIIKVSCLVTFSNLHSMNFLVWFFFLHSPRKRQEKSFIPQLQPLSFYHMAHHSFNFQHPSPFIIIVSSQVKGQDGFSDFSFFAPQIAHAPPTCKRLHYYCFHLCLHII